MAAKNDRYGTDQDKSAEDPVEEEVDQSIEDVEIDIENQHEEIKEQQKIEEIRRGELLR